jgi:hypothetical protein
MFIVAHFGSDVERGAPWRRSGARRGRRLVSFLWPGRIYRRIQL